MGLTRELSLLSLILLFILLFSFLRFSFIHGGGKIDQVVGREILNVADERANGGAKLRDRVLQFYSLSFRY